MPTEWYSQGPVDPRAYVCGFCGHHVAGSTGFRLPQTLGVPHIVLCSFCGQPSYFDPHERQWPGVAFGNSVEHLPEDVGSLYDEARRCCSVSAYTSATLACRKLLMAIAVSHGAKEGESFQSYVDWLSQNGYVPPNGKAWVDRIRKLGNEATHQVATKSQADAELAVGFTEILLKIIYEFPAQAAALSPPDNPPA